MLSETGGLVCRLTSYRYAFVAGTLCVVAVLREDCHLILLAGLHTVSAIEIFEVTLPCALFLPEVG